MYADVKKMVGEAQQAVNQLTVEEARALLEDSSTVAIDVRSTQETVTDGKIPGSINIPRGVLEFAMDSSTPYYNPVFESGKRLIFYCKSGGRSALAAKFAHDQGVPKVYNIDGGMLSWNKA